MTGATVRIPWFPYTVQYIPRPEPPPNLIIGWQISACLQSICPPRLWPPNSVTLYHQQGRIWSPLQLLLMMLRRLSACCFRLHLSFGVTVQNMVATRHFRLDLLLQLSTYGADSAGFALNREAFPWPPSRINLYNF